MLRVRIRMRNRRALCNPVSWCLMIILMSLKWNAESFPLSGIPRVKVGRISQPRETEGNMEIKDRSGRWANEEGMNPEELQLMSNLSSSEMEWKTTTTTEGNYPVLTDLEDLEDEWEEFDSQWKSMKNMQEQGTRLDENFHFIVMARSVRALIWPVTVVFGTLAITGILVLTLCLTRRQIYCCGKPCFDSSLDAASNYDRSEMRREKMRLIKTNPLATRSLDDTEINGIVECMRRGRPHQGKIMKREEFMQEYERRFRDASFAPISPPCRNKCSSRESDSAEEIMMTRRKMCKGGEVEVGMGHEYDEVLDLQIQEL